MMRMRERCSQRGNDFSIQSSTQQPRFLHRLQIKSHNQVGSQRTGLRQMPGWKVFQAFEELVLFQTFQDFLAGPLHQQVI